MTPRQQAINWYMRRYGPDWWITMWERDLSSHASIGYVFSSSKFIMLARPVKRGFPALIANPWHEFDLIHCDAWYIWLATGDISMLWDCMPFYLPYIGWARRGGPQRFYKTERLREKCRNNPLHTRALS